MFTVSVQICSKILEVRTCVIDFVTPSTKTDDLNIRKSKIIIVLSNILNIIEIRFPDLANNIEGSQLNLNIRLKKKHKNV